MKWLVLLAGFVVFPVVIMAQQSSAPAPASVSTEGSPIYDKALPQVFVKPLTADLSQIQGWQPALGEGLAEMLTTELTNTGKFQMLESTAVGDLVDEIKMGEAGYMSDKEKVDKGGFAGADYMFVGKVTRFGSKTEGVDLGGFIPGSGGAFGIKNTTSEVRIDWRFTDAYTRKVIVAGQAIGKNEGTGFNIGVGVNGSGGNIGFSNHEFMNSALGKATVKALNKIIAEVSSIDLPISGRRMAKANAANQQAAAAASAASALKNTPGKVLAVPAKGVLIVSLGAKSGFKSGDRLKLYETIDTKDDKGVVVFTEEKLVGEITLDMVQDDRSKANYTGDAAPQAGWSVKNF